MLNPNQRRLLLDAVRPPEGYRFDQLIATTYSLDLVALMGISLALSVLDREQDDINGDSLRLLESVRRQSERLTVFCQAGQIKCPREYRTLFAWLESSVVEALAPSETGAFHPKVWFLRYLGNNNATRYRLLCLSRNLTYDCSWDSALVLEGELEPSAKKNSNNVSISRFVSELAELSKYPLSARHARRLQLISSEIERVKFVMPDNISAMVFHPIGIKRFENHIPFLPLKGLQPRLDRLLILSPFVSADFVRDLLIRGGKKGRRLSLSLNSRFDSLESMTADELAEVQECRYFHQPAAADEDSEDLLSGLHAKLFIADQGHDATIWTGSANATWAAFHHNIEFLVELQGRKSRLGIDKFLERQPGVSNLVDMLIPFEPDAVTQEVSDLQLLEATVDKLRLAIVRRKFSGDIEVNQDSFDLTLQVDLSDLHPEIRPDALELLCRPLTLAEGYAQTLDVGSASSCTFTGLSTESLTSFFTLDIKAKANNICCEQSFVINVPITGMPENRQQDLLLMALKNRGDFLRYLNLLLSGDEISSALQISEAEQSQGIPNGVDLDVRLPLFEQMVKALYSEPSKLDQIASLVQELEKTDQGRSILPPDFQQIWRPLWQAHRTGVQ